MENVIIAIIAVIAVLGVLASVKHFKGESGCCGSGNYKPKRKKLSSVCCKKRFLIDGMHCKHCQARVEEVVNDIKGVSGRVDLKRNELTVSYSENVDDELIVSRIEKSGYTVTKIEAL